MLVTPEEIADLGLPVLREGQVSPEEADIPAESNFEEVEDGDC
jgi:hypothetical protein